MKKVHFSLVIGILLFFSSAVFAQENIRTGMIEISQRAVDTVRNVDGASLDFSVESLKEIDRIILDIREKEGNDPKPFRHVLFMIGVYVGEVFIRNIEGLEWVSPPEELVEKGVAEESEIWLKTKGGSFNNPIGKVYKLMLNGKEDSVYNLYRYVESKNS